MQHVAIEHAFRRAELHRRAFDVGPLQPPMSWMRHHWYACATAEAERLIIDGLRKEAALKDTWMAKYQRRWIREKRALQRAAKNSL
ncbi:MAG: hypothetical protein V3T90_11815 [Anaerolineae bacterium]|jgi:hypothetical protein